MTIIQIVTKMDINGSCYICVGSGGKPSFFLRGGIATTKSSTVGTLQTDNLD